MYKKVVHRLPGQVSIEDYLAEIQALETSCNTLTKGQVVFLLEKGNIIRYEVYGIYEIDEVDTVVLISNTASLFKTIPLSELGTSLFENIGKAENALALLSSSECIFAKDMHIKSYKHFKAVHKNGYPLEAFYAELDNGYVYMKDYFNCGFLIKVSTKEAEKILQKQIDSYSYKATETDTIPELKDMYRTHCSGNWEYAEIACPLTNVG